MPKRKATPKPKAADTRPVNQRGQEWQAQKLTGNRAQSRRSKSKDYKGRMILLF